MFCHLDSKPFNVAMMFSRVNAGAAGKENKHDIAVLTCLNYELKPCLPPSYVTVHDCWWIQDSLKGKRQLIVYTTFSSTITIVRATLSIVKTIS